MTNLFWTLLIFIVQVLICMGIFAAVVFVVKFIDNKFKSSRFFESSKFFNLNEYLPYEEITTLKQVYYLVMIIFFVVQILYTLVNWNTSHILFIYLDIIVSIYLVTQMDRISIKDKIILFTLIPLGSLSSLIFPDAFIFNYINLIHVVAYVYFIKVYYKKFFEYTDTNSLGITIMLLFMIIFISFLITIVVESVSPINSIAMVSNAFTSNGYAILGKSDLGKLNALVLVWAGFVLSGVGTATLTVAIVMKHVDEKFDNLEELAKKNKKN